MAKIVSVRLTKKELKVLKRAVGPFEKNETGIEMAIHKLLSDVHEEQKARKVIITDVTPYISENDLSDDYDAYDKFISECGDTDNPFDRGDNE